MGKYLHIYYEQLNPVQSMKWGGYKTSGFILAWGDCHNDRSDRNCGYRLIAADRTRKDEHNGWLNLCFTLNIASSTDHSVGRR